MYLAEYLLSHLSSRKMEVHSPSAILLRSSDLSAAGSSTEFLKTHLTFRTDASGQEVCLVEADGEEIGVMMGWERGLSEFGTSFVLQAISNFI